MSYVFTNAGAMDPRSITTFGVSSKEGKAPIGFFGTGLKYAIAVLLRLKCNITIHTGGEIYTFDTQSTRIRVNDFDIVTMNGEPLGFTTELGKTWEMWQAFRELACNAVDENGDYYETNEPFVRSHDHTTIIVEGAAFASAWADRHTVILDTARKNLLHEGENIDIYSGRTEYVYYRGVRIAKLDKTDYTFNIKRGVDLTEDRTCKYQFQITDTVSSELCRNVEDRAIITDFVTKGRTDGWLGELAYHAAPSETFKDVVGELIRKFHPTLNVSAKTLVQRGDLGSFLVDETSKLDRIDRDRLKTAIAFCVKLGHPVNEYPIVVSGCMGPSLLGMAEKNVIYISTRTFSMGTKMLAGTLLEEYWHLKHDVRDETRTMQNLLIDIICSLGERITKKAL